MTLEQALHEIDKVNHQQAILSYERQRQAALQSQAKRESEAQDIELLAIELSGELS